jgi:hypothetical protein
MTYETLSYSQSNPKYNNDWLPDHLGWPRCLWPGVGKEVFSKGEADKARASKDFSEQFNRAGRYTAGLIATYADSPISKACWTPKIWRRILKLGCAFQIHRLYDSVMPKQCSWWKHCPLTVDGVSSYLRKISEMRLPRVDWRRCYS